MGGRIELIKQGLKWLKGPLKVGATAFNGYVAVDQTNKAGLRAAELALHGDKMSTEQQVRKTVSAAGSTVAAVSTVPFSWYMWAKNPSPKLTSTVNWLGVISAPIQLAHGYEGMTDNKIIAAKAWEQKDLEKYAEAKGEEAYGRMTMFGALGATLAIGGAYYTGGAAAALALGGPVTVALFATLGAAMLYQWYNEKRAREQATEAFSKQPETLPTAHKESASVQPAPGQDATVRLTEEKGGPPAERYAALKVQPESPPTPVEPASRQTEVSSPTKVAAKTDKPPLKSDGFNHISPNPMA